MTEKEKLNAYAESCVIEKEELLIKLTKLVNDFYEIEGTYPDEINLVAEGYSQKVFGKHIVKLQLNQKI